jgi:hypothetical protein
MNSTINPIDSCRITLHRDAKQYTGLKISPGSRPDIYNLRSDSTWDTAWIYRDGEITEWIPEGHVEYQGRYCIGPSFDGERLSLVIDSNKLDLATIRKVLSACIAINTQKQKLELFDAASIFLLDDGSVLLLSSSLAKKQRLCRTSDELTRDFEKLKHPDLRYEDGLVYSFALLAYIALTGRHPFINSQKDIPLENKKKNREEEEKEEEIREQLRRREFVPLSLMKPGINEEASAYLDSVLDGSREKTDIQELLQNLQRIVSSPGPAVSSVELRHKEALAARRERQIRRLQCARRFFHTYTVHLIIAGIMIIAGAALTFNILQKASVPSPTRGLEPEQVVQLFYESMNSLDHDTMEACVTDGAGKNYIEAAVRLTVISRVSAAYSVGGPPPFVSAQEWVDAGLPPLERGRFIFGAADLSLEKIGETDFRVRYFFAQPSGGDMEESESINIRITEHIEIVKLLRGTDDYSIYSIEPEEKREIDSFRDLKKE